MLTSVTEEDHDANVLCFKDQQGSLTRKNFFPYFTEAETGSSGVLTWGPLSGFPAKDVYFTCVTIFSVVVTVLLVPSGQAILHWYQFNLQ